MIFGKFLGFTAFVAGSCFIGYCLYFDRKRRSDPDYRKKVHERREKAKKKMMANGRSGHIDVPDLSDHSSIERYFMQEVILGEKDIERDELESGVQHLANALVVCGQPVRLLQILQNTFSPEVFAMLLQKMREIGTRMAAEHNLAIPGINAPVGQQMADMVQLKVKPSTIQETVDDDLE